MKGSRSIRNASQLPVESSAHTLIVCGLTAALKSITRTQANELMKNRGSKPEIQVLLSDSTFAEALQNKIARRPGKPLRAGRNWLIELARQLSRFNVSFTTDPER